MSHSYVIIYTLNYLQIFFWVSSNWAKAQIFTPKQLTALHFSGETEQLMYD